MLPSPLPGVARKSPPRSECSAVSATLRLVSVATVEKRHRFQCDRADELPLPNILYHDPAWQPGSDRRSRRTHPRAASQRRSAGRNRRPSSEYTQP